MKEYKFKINGKEYQVAIGEASGNMLSVNVNGADYQVELENMNAAAAAISAGAKKQANAPAEIAAASASSSASAAASSAAAPAATGAGQTIKSPLPGIIISVDVKEGQAVKRGQKVAVIEAMKMENDILAECDGTVTAVHARKGDSVLEGADIVTIG
ncbi:MAG TPA: acetyl-CoA carboxylase biotin carboxyl carrier protein subunit [Rikenellaceae bacterium]|nr:acetyl-CoA carboxylase biotin carboxyl carrier protein subunit [Rikenellaceae bacterium]